MTKTRKISRRIRRRRLRRQRVRRRGGAMGTRIACDGVETAAAAACELIGLGPEDPFADVCAVEMVRGLRASCRYSADAEGKLLLTNREQLRQMIRPKTSKTKKSKTKGGARGERQLALLNPRQSAHLVTTKFTKFMRPFSHAVLARVGQHGSPRDIMAAIQENIRKPAFKAAWAQSVTEIFDILLTPILGQTVQLVEKEGINIIKAFAKIIRKGAFALTTAAAAGLESALSVVPGIGTALDLLTAIQALISTLTTLTVQSLKVMTRIVVAVLTLTGHTIDPLVKIAPTIRKIMHALLGTTGAKTTRRRRRRRRRRRQLRIQDIPPPWLKN